MPYRVVEQFEQALCDYTGAHYAVALNSCSSAIFLALKRWVDRNGALPMRIPGSTYCSVPNAIKQAGAAVEFEDVEWLGAYRIKPTNVWDCARRFTWRMYDYGQIQCVSFQASKILGLEQGGAILHDDPDADDWYRRARFDGRLNASERLPAMVGWHCYMNPSTAALGLSRLACLPRLNPDQCGSEAFADLSGLGLW